MGLRDDLMQRTMEVLVSGTKRKLEQLGHRPPYRSQSVIGMSEPLSLC